MPIALVGIAVTLVVIGGVLTLLTLTGVRNDLDVGRRALVRARAALVRGDIDPAQRLLDQAGARFSGAAGEMEGVVAKLARLTPLLGRNVSVARGIADAGSALSRAGLGLVREIRGLPGGFDALAPKNGRLQLQAMSALAETARTSARDADTALDAIAATPETLLLGPVDQARWEALTAIRDAEEALITTGGLLEGLPSFAGSFEERRYLFFAENPAELRSTGGLWGAFSVLTMRDGRLELARFRPIQVLRVLSPDVVPAPNPDYRANYDQYGGAGMWRSMNISPDFPSAARAALASWEIIRDERLDGVIAADPFALQALLRVTGPTRIPSLGVTVGAGNIVPYVSNRAYGTFDDAESRKEVIGQAAEVAFTRFMAMEGRGFERLSAIARTAGSGHLKVYVTDTALQEALARTGSGSALGSVPEGDLLAVYVNNSSESKIDFYVHRAVSYDIRLGGAREAFGTTVVRLRNQAPTEGPSQVVIGPNIPHAEAGDEVHLLASWCPRDCSLVEAERDGTEISVREGLELGRRFYFDFATVPAGDTSSFRTVTSRAGAWTGNLSSGRYRLTVLPQTTIVPTEFRVRIQAPEGTEIVWATDGVAVSEGGATWSGTPTAPFTLEVRFQAPVPLRWWRNLIGLLSF